MCRKERLTFFNFIRMHSVSDGELDMNEEQIKEMINREYMVYFKRGQKLDIYREPGAFFKKPATNEVNRRFKVAFQ